MAPPFVLSLNSVRRKNSGHTLNQPNQSVSGHTHTYARAQRALQQRLISFRCKSVQCRMKHLSGTWPIHPSDLSLFLFHLAAAAVL